MDVQTPFRSGLESPTSLPLGIPFLVLWFVDAVTAILFFVVPNATELNPVTVLCYELFGLPGVALAAGVYAAIVIVVSRSLSNPLDRLFMTIVVVAYAAFVSNNVSLLATGDPVVLDLIGA